MIDPDVMRQNNQINQLLQKGMTVKDISEELEVSEWLVFKVAKATNAYNDKDGKRII
jgi:orotate phosphoribosyltransferase-like protein